MSDEYSEREYRRVLKRVHKWVVEFSKSERFAQLTEEQKDESEAVIMYFAEFMYDYLGLPPAEWDEDGLSECCLEIFPAKVSAEEAFFQAVAPVLKSFFLFCAEKGYLANGSLLARAVEQLGPQIVRQSKNRRNWGPAKQFVMAALQSGVDVEDEAEMDAFMATFNMRLMQAYGAAQWPSPPPPPKPPVSRNAPCPCGSGKKYKKCCGKT